MRNSASSAVALLSACHIFMPTMSVLSDIVRVPITTNDGPAFVLIGSSSDLNQTLSRNNQAPEGILIVKEAGEGFDVQFIASETIPETMKTLIIEKMSSVRFSEEPKYTGDAAADFVEPTHAPEEPLVTEFLGASTSTRVSTNDPVESMEVLEKHTSVNDGSMGMDVEQKGAHDDEAVYEVTAPVDISGVGYPSGGNITSTLAPRSGKIDSRGQQSGKLTGQRDSASSARTSHALMPAFMTIFLCVFVSVSVGVM